jgi:hypothetical protein
MAIPCCVYYPKIITARRQDLYPYFPKLLRGTARVAAGGSATHERFNPPCETEVRKLDAFKTKGLRADVEYTLLVEDRRMTIIRGVP